MKLPAMLLLSMVPAVAQNETAKPSFDAASLKPASPDHGLGPLRGGAGTTSPGQLTGTASLKVLLMRAYQLKDYQVLGPPWLDSERYDIAAKIASGATKRQVSLMLQVLLVERFGLQVHRESKDLPILALVVSKGGAKLTASDPNNAAPDAAEGTRFSPKFKKGSDGFPEMVSGQKMPRSYEMVIGGSDGLLYKLWARGETIEQLADRLSAQLGKPVVDRTGLAAAYDFALTWTVETGGAGIPRTGPPPDEIDMHNSPILTDPGLSIFTALPAQLGLKLEAKRGPVEILIVDKADKVPREN